MNRKHETAARHARSELGLAFAIAIGAGSPAVAIPAVPPLPVPPAPPAQVPAPAPAQAPTRAPSPSPASRAPTAPAPKPAAKPAAAPAAAPAAQSLMDAFLKGKIIADVRYRFEHVEQDGFANEADAHTIRARAGFQTAKFWDTQILVEGEAVGHLNDRFNDTVNGNTTFPVVADPEDVQLNRLQIDFSGIPGTTVTVGRQRINLDNQRFIGAVGFRQNEQTFDAARITSTYFKGLTASYIYLNRVNRIFGEDSSAGSFTGDTHLVNVAYDIKDWGKLTGYAYFLDLSSAPALSTETFGARFAGRHTIGGGLSALYAGEYARQKPYADNAGAFELDYWQAEAGLAYRDFKVLAGKESLEGDGVRGFSTPLATLHKFQGYADVFLTTPANGIADRYATLGYETKLKGVSPPITGIMAAVTYHDFDAERISTSFGSEIDVELAVKIGKRWSIGAKYADYQGDGAFADRKKFWIPIEFVF